MNEYLSPRRPLMPSDTAAPSRVLHINVELDFWWDLNDMGHEEREDFEVPGLYEVLVASDLSDARAANCALDGFHSTIAINGLDGFTYTVFDPTTGEVMGSDEDTDSYQLTHRCRGVRLLERFVWTKSDGERWSWQPPIA